VTVRFALVASTMMVFSALFLLFVPQVNACHNQTNSCEDSQVWSDGNMSPDVVELNPQPSPKTIAPGQKAYFNSTMSLSPGCGSSYYLYATLGSVPAGWRATYTTDPDGGGTDLSNVDNVAWGNGNRVVKAYLVVTAPMQVQEGDSITITTMLGADDNARNDKDLVYAKCTIKIHIPHPSPMVAQGLSSFSIAEDTTDDTHVNLTKVFKNVDDDPVQYGVEQTSSIVISVYQTGRVVFKPKPDWNGVETINFNCKDGLSAYVTTSVLVTVTAVPDQPILAAPLKDFAIPQDGDDVTTVNLNKVFYDADTPYGDKLAFAASGQQNIVVTIKADGKVGFKPAMGWSGEEVINFTATDEAKSSVSDEVKVTVTDSSRPPSVKNPLKDISFPEDTFYEGIDLSTVFVSPEFGVVLVYDVSGNVNLNVSLRPDGKVTITPPKDWNGVETLAFSAYDGMFSPVFDDMMVTVEGVNDPPYQKKPLNITMDEDTASEPVFMEYYFGDVDRDKLSYKMDSTETLTVTIFQRTGELTITPVLNYNGESELRLIVSDAQADLVVKVPVKVDPRDDTPIITEWLPGGNCVCTEGDEISFSFKAMDIDGDVIGSKWEVDQNFSPFAKFDNKDSIKFKATAGMATGAGTHTLTVWVDGGQRSSVSHSWQLTVKLANRAPSVPTITTPRADQNFTTRSDIQFDVLAEDPDLDPMTYKWFIDGSEASTQKSFTQKLAAGAHTVKVTATDEHGLSASSGEMTLTVKKPTPPASKSSTPGFELLGLMAAMGAALVLLRRRK